MIIKYRKVLIVDPLPPECEIEQCFDRAKPILDARIDQIIDEQIGNLCWYWPMIELKPPYNARNRKRLTDKLIPE